MMRRIAVFLALVACTLSCSLFADEAGQTPSAHASNPARLAVTMSAGGKNIELKAWSYDQLKALRAVASREKEPSGRALAHFKGVALSVLLDSAMGALTAEQKAHFDLVILSDADGKHAVAPRSFIVKYPMLVAYEKDGKPLGRDMVMTVPPWSSHPKCLKEDLPVETYFVNRLAAIELANYREHFGTLFLKRRTDPSAMRGEKIFVQNCAPYHPADKTVPVKAMMDDCRKRILASRGQPSSNLTHMLNERDMRALSNYFDAYQAENAGKSSTQSN